MSQEFISMTDGACYYRSKLLSAARAASFCGCLQSNSRFKQVSVQRSTSEGQFFVQYQPSSQARYGAMYARQYEMREELGRTEGRCYQFDLHSVQGRDFYLCQSTSGETYEVTPESCSCPDFVHRCQKAGLSCKHQLAYAAQIAIGEIVSLAVIRESRKPKLYSDQSWEVEIVSFCSCGKQLVTAAEKRRKLCNACYEAPLDVEILPPAKKHFDYRKEREYDFA